MEKHKKNGYIALISLIIIGAIVLSLALAITFIILNQTRNTIDQNQALKSYYLANACAHYALIKLQDNTNYAGNETINTDNYSFYIEQILGSGNFNRIIKTSSNINGHLAKIEVIVGQIKPKTIINSWQEIF